MKTYKSPPRIFILDDCMTECLLMKNSLEQAGYNVHVETESQEGLTRILAHPPQCLVLDVVLPTLSGYAVCRRIRRADPQHTLPIIMVSSKRTPLDKKYAFEVGADQYLIKPFPGHVLVEAVSAVLPEALRPATSRSLQQLDIQSMTSPDQSRSMIEGLIPSRQQETDILTVSSPFADVSLLSNVQLRHVYSAIDNRRTVQALSERLQLDVQTLLPLLKVLWQHHFITFYDTSYRPIKELSFLL